MQVEGLGVSGDSSRAVGARDFEFGGKNRVAGGRVVVFRVTGVGRLFYVGLASQQQDGDECFFCRSVVLFAFIKRFRGCVVRNVFKIEFVKNLFIRRSKMVF